MRIAIVGAGLAGLSLARILHVHGIGACVYERDPSPHARSQGGTLDLHPESGQYALVAAGLAEQFYALARSEGEEHKIFSPSGDLLVHRVPDATGRRPEIDRTDLRDLLIGSLPAAAIHWGAQVVAVEDGAAGGWQLSLADGTRSECDLLVGADGGSSLLRARLTDVAPSYLSSYAQMSIPDVDRTHPELARLVGHGSLWALGHNQNLTAQRESSGLVRVSAMVRSTGPWRPAGRSEVLQRYADWSPSLTALVQAADDPAVAREIRVTPPGMGWSSHPSLTLVGDAAHLMPPVGEGANQALRDAADLAAEVIANPDDPAGAIARYETQMRARIGPIERDSAKMEKLILSATALVDMVRFFTRPAIREPSGAATS
ncbi:MAG: FAD-dependent monooxygenase [Microlunatus sp.]|nr:FAD-dependent monooxygenase [Microlunatus sp.]MDN5770672.1 FAD-dependent monooxygenase [Microlunatus sp.]MDN5803575.1 FAD-dependent monooxygenase [Microlunatus sp.]